MRRLKSSIERQWYSRPDWLLLFAPLAALFRLLAAWRRRNQSAAAMPSPVPVLVVGNIVVGGTGKTPVIIELCRALRAAGRRPVVISRGYGVPGETCRVLPPNAEAAEFGDEPVLIARATLCPVVVGADRAAAVRQVKEQNLGDLVLSDDGLQHYRLARTWEIAVIDGERRLGNGWCLPVGPLREPPARLLRVNAVLINGPLFSAPWLPQGRTFEMQLQPRSWRHLRSGSEVALNDLNLDGATAVAGIGNPQRFFATLRTLGFAGASRAFPDHHPFQPRDFAGLETNRVLLTEKDAVKVQAFAGQDWWSLAVDAQLPAALVREIIAALGDPAAL